MIKIGDMVQWRDQINYRGLCGIVTEWHKDSYEDLTYLFVHWTSFPKNYAVGSAWEKAKDLEVVSTGETQ